MSRDEFRRVVHHDPVDLGLACLLMGRELEPDLDVSEAQRWLDQLAAAVPAVDPGDVRECARALRATLHDFGGTPDDYGDVRSSLLHAVLRSKRGLPILLTVVWLEVAKRAGLPAFPVGLPGYFLAGVGSPDGSHVLVDPFAHGAPVEPAPAAARPYDDREVILRVLNNVRAQAAARPALVESARTALWAVELSLLLPRHPVSLRRERGLLLVQVGDFAGAAAELDVYANVVSEVDPAAAQAARREARLAMARLN